MDVAKPPPSHLKLIRCQQLIDLILGYIVRFIRSTTASTRPLPTKRTLTTDLVTILAVCQQPYYYSNTLSIFTSSAKNEGAVEGGGKKILLVHPQPDRRHKTTTNRKSVKHWSSDCIGGIPRVSLLSYDDINEAACVNIFFT